MQDADDPPKAAQARSPWFSRIVKGLAATRAKLGERLENVFARSPTLDDNSLEELETVLLAADVGVAATRQLLDELKLRFRKNGNTMSAQAVLKGALVDLLTPLNKSFAIGEARPLVVMIAGVNGAGKTTSIGKLAKMFRSQGHSVLLAAGDTFRAAADDQLQEWGRRNEITVISQHGGDPAAVMFDAISAAKARRIDIILADTAGRLATQYHLMEELKKVKRVIAKAHPGAPHEILLVLDANMGQNVLAQVRAFDAALGVTGLVLTKLDGTAKGGVIAAIAKEHPIPINFIGVGEGIDDLRPFAASEFVSALFDE